MIYFARLIGTNLVKIGYAKHNVVGRLKTLQTGSPGELELLGSSDGDLRREQLLHHRFAASRVRGEWFDMTPDLAAEIALANPGFAALVKLDAKVIDIVRMTGEAIAGESFCANDMWYGYSGYGVKDRLTQLVGYLRKRGPAELEASDAYSLVYDVAYRLLPSCGRRCACGNGHTDDDDE